MKLSYKDYNFDDSLRMMDSVLSAPSDVIRDSDSIPSKDMLNASNAYFVYYTVVHIRLLGVTASMESNQEAYFKVNKVALEEFIALCRSYQQCEDVNICNQTVTVVLNTRYKKDIDDVISLVSKIRSIVDVINLKLCKRQNPLIKIAIGIDYGKGLMMKLSDDSNKEQTDVCWLGDVVNQAILLSSFAGKSYLDGPIMISDAIYANLNEDNQKMFKRNVTHNCYHGSLQNKRMNEWCKENSI